MDAAASKLIKRVHYWLGTSLSVEPPKGIQARKFYSWGKKRASWWELFTELLWFSTEISSCNFFFKFSRCPLQIDLKQRMLSCLISWITTHLLWVAKWALSHDKEQTCSYFFQQLDLPGLKWPAQELWETCIGRKRFCNYMVIRIRYTHKNRWSLY